MFTTFLNIKKKSGGFSILYKFVVSRVYRVNVDSTIGYLIAVCATVQDDQMKETHKTYSVVFQQGRTE